MLLMAPNSAAWLLSEINFCERYEVVYFITWDCSVGILKSISLCGWRCMQCLFHGGGHCKTHLSSVLVDPKCQKVHASLPRSWPRCHRLEKINFVGLKCWLGVGHLWQHGRTFVAIKGGHLMWRWCGSGGPVLTQQPPSPSSSITLPLLFMDITTLIILSKTRQNYELNHFSLRPQCKLYIGLFWRPQYRKHNSSIVPAVWSRDCIYPQ